MQLRHQLVDVRRMQAGGRLVEDVERVATAGALQFGGQLDALRLAARQLGGRLSQPQVAQAHFAQHGQRARQRSNGNAGIGGKKFGGRVDRHGQDFGDILVAIAHRQRGVVIARAAAHGTGRVHAGQEQQFHHHRAFAGAVGAAALGDVEREAAGVEMPGARRTRGGEQLAHVVEQAGVGGQVGARRAAYRFLVDLHQPPQAGHAAADAAIERRRGPAGEGLVRVRLGAGGGRPQLRAHQLHQRLADQARFAGAGNAAHAGHHAERKIGVQAMQIMAHYAAQTQPVGGGTRRARGRRATAEQIMRGARLPHRCQPGRNAAI